MNPPVDYNPIASNPIKGDPMVLKPTNLNIGLGTIEIAQERRQAYEKAAAKAGSRSLAEWARELLDKESGFKKK